MSRNLSGTPKSKGKIQHLSANKSKRKIIFDSHVSPLIQKREVCIVSPESLSSKRSRSGRLVVPPLHFWRNQIPICDVDRNMIVIQEDVHVFEDQNRMLVYAKEVDPVMGVGSDSLLELPTAQLIQDRH
ncbi:hypothetical protein HS088_TW13G00031 [Tripterygium wilfordii]|uniref:Uncharacterized protein n=1 Tax=Tripterygium wilfordii TaxID=458696 RepID=A0A7J7CSU1_TRIWF|nr:hypothetical protein HS088_TW13G00031 [Tripterygium wilfordii]